MANQPFDDKDSGAAAPTALHDLQARVAALELFAQQLVLVLDGEGTLNADALTRWMCAARARMAHTGSVPAAHVQALARLQELVQQ